MATQTTYTPLATPTTATATTSPAAPLPVAGATPTTSILTPAPQLAPSPAQLTATSGLSSGGLTGGSDRTLAVNTVPKAQITNPTPVTNLYTPMSTPTSTTTSTVPSSTTTSSPTQSTSTGTSTSTSTNTDQSTANQSTLNQNNDATTAALQQVTDYINSLAGLKSEDYSSMTPDQLEQAITGASSALHNTMQTIGSVVQAGLQVQMPNIDATLSDYMTKIDAALNDYAQKAQDAYNNGMKDPGLVQAIDIIARQATIQKQQLDEELNARGMSQSGVWINAMQQFDEGVQNQQQTVINTHLSQLTQNLQSAMQSILQQRVAALTQFAGMQSQAELEITKMQIDKLSTAVSSLTGIMNTQQADINSQRDYAAKKQQLAEQKVEFEKSMAEKIREADQQVEQFNKTYQLEQQKLAETIRSNQSQEAIARQRAAAEAAQAAAAQANARAAAARVELERGQQSLAEQERQAYYTGNTYQAIAKLQQDIDSGKVNFQDVVADPGSYKASYNIYGGDNPYQQAQYDIWKNYYDQLVSQKNSASSGGGGGGSWWSSPGGAASSYYGRWTPGQ